MKIIASRLIYICLIPGKNVNLNGLIYVKTRKSLQAFHVTKWHFLSYLDQSFCLVKSICIQQHIVSKLQKVYKWWLQLIRIRMKYFSVNFLFHNCSDFLGVKIFHFVKTLQSEAKWSRELLGKLLKNCYISIKKVMKSPRFWKNLGRFLAFFFWNCHIYLTISSSSPIQNRIPRFSTSLFVL